MGLSDRIVFPGKRAAEVENLTFDFTSKLASGVTISSATTTCTVYSGTDATPSAVISGAASISGSVVTQKVTGGTLGVIYQLLCAATTSTTETLELCGFLAIIPDSM